MIVTDVLEASFNIFVVVGTACLLFVFMLNFNYLAKIFLLFQPTSLLTLTLACCWQKCSFSPLEGAVTLLKAYLEHRRISVNQFIKLPSMHLCKVKWNKRIVHYLNNTNYTITTWLSESNMCSLTWCCISVAGCTCIMTALTFINGA